MAATFILLLTVTALYTGYNLLIKVSSGYVPLETTTTILATITLQVAALGVSCIFALALLVRGGEEFSLSVPAFFWAAAAGLCIGAAEIGYFYLFRGTMDDAPVSANFAIPVIVGGTILLAIAASWIFLNESLSWAKAVGGAMIVAGVIVMFLDKSPLRAG